MTERAPLAQVATGRPIVIGETDAGETDVEEVGAKAYDLIRMAEAGLAVPPGFVLGTEVCAAYHAGGGELDESVRLLIERGIQYLESATQRRFGGRRHPLLVSVRSGAAVSMPGMLETLLDVGLNDTTLPGLLRDTGDPVFVWDTYRRLVQNYAEVVDGCPAGPMTALVEEAVSSAGVAVPGELDLGELRQVVHRLQALYLQSTGRPFPQDARVQLLGAVKAVLRSWNGARAVEYRRLRGLEGLTGTAVTVQAMVFGNIGVASGAGVAFTRDPATGADQLYVDFALDAQGEDVVGGRLRTGEAESLIAGVPGLRGALERTRQSLESLFADAQDFEFTVEEGTLWLLQARPAKRTAWAALQIACDLVDQGLISPATALERLEGYDLQQVTLRRLATGAGTVPLARAVSAGAGVAAGRIVLDADGIEQYRTEGEDLVLFRPEALTEDLALLTRCRGLVSAAGARTSHAAVVARELGIVCLVGCRSLAIDQRRRCLRLGDTELPEGSEVTVDGGTGLIYAGRLEVVEERPVALLDRVRQWAAAAGPGLAT